MHKSLHDNHDDNGIASVGANPDGVDLYGHAQTLWVLEPGDAHTPSPNDIHQGAGLGDCFILSPLGMIAEEDPAYIRSGHGMIRDNGNGTQTVRLFKDGATGGPVTWSTSSFKPTFITVNDVFVAGTDNSRLATDGYYNGRKEIWSQVVEKAVATLDTGHTVTTLGDYDPIAHGGYAALAMETLTGQKATVEAPGLLTAASLKALLTAHDLVTLDTGNPAGAFGLVGDHCYMVKSVSDAGMVQCINPWGFQQPAAIPIGALSQAFVQADIGGQV